MAFNSILRKSTSSLRPLGGQFKTQRNYHSVLFTAINHNQATHSRKVSFSLNSFLSTFPLSTKAAARASSDEILIRVIQSEIECAEETDDHNGAEEIPPGFPFEIRDSPGQQTLLLERTYQGEEIKVEVQMPDLVTGKNDDDRDEDEDDSERASQSSIPLVVTVFKKGGPLLEFSCMAYPDEITIDNLAVNKPDSSDDQVAYEGPVFKDLDENLKKSFLKYLEIRGIKPSTTNFLHEYMISKDNKEYLLWLKKVIRFIEA